MVWLLAIYICRFTINTDMYNSYSAARLNNLSTILLEIGLNTLMYVFVVVVVVVDLGRFVGCLFIPFPSSNNIEYSFQL